MKPHDEPKRDDAGDDLFATLARLNAEADAARDEWQGLANATIPKSPPEEARAFLDQQREAGRQIVGMSIDFAAIVLEALEFLAAKDAADDPPAPRRAELAAAIVTFRAMFDAAGPVCRKVAKNAQARGEDRAEADADVVELLIERARRQERRAQAAERRAAEATSHCETLAGSAEDVFAKLTADVVEGPPKP